MSVFTVYNCGTAFDQNRNDAVANLWRDTASADMITDGVGSEGKLDSVNWFRAVKENKATGNMFGVGVDANVNKVIGKIKKDYQQEIVQKTLRLNMCGWSRGAVTCFKIANLLHNDQDPRVQDIPIRIFAIDPVPGSAGRFNKHMWKNIKLNANVKECTVILAEHERRREFNPVLDEYMLDANRPDGWDFDTMPGDHSGILVATGNHKSAPAIMEDMAKTFLYQGGQGTTFRNKTFLSRLRILGHYAQIMLELDSYKKGYWASWGAMRKRRVVRTQNEKGKALTKVGSLVPKAKDANQTPLKGKARFWANSHHRLQFVAEFPSLGMALVEATGGNYNKLNKLLNNGSSVQRDFLRLAADGSAEAGHIYQQVVAYLLMLNLDVSSASFMSEVFQVT
jgi:hypothetical protein